MQPERAPAGLTVVRDFFYSHRGFSPVLKELRNIATVQRFPSLAKFQRKEQTVETVDITAFQLEHRAEAAVRMRKIGAYQ